MANRSSMMTAMAQAYSRMQSNLYKPPPTSISGVDGDIKWPSPLQPVLPMGPPGSAPLGFNIWMGQNLIYTPRVDAVLTAPELRQLATYPLARICIENVKDAITTLKWRIQVTPQPGENEKERKAREDKDGTVGTLTDFFNYPDGYNSWDTWLRPFLEDMLVIDAGTILMRRSFNNKIQQLRVIDGSTIVQYIDDNGFVPEDGSPAFSQLWDGIPRVNLTTDQLFYKPRNIVRRNTLSSQLYGMSPTEELAEEIKVGQERLNFVLAYYTDGAVPGLVHIVPADANADKVKENMQWMNSELAGNLTARRQWRVIQGYHNADDAREDQIFEPKEPVLADVFDDMHIRKVAFGYGTSAQRLLKAMNRSSAEAGQDAAESEGILPYVVYVANSLNYIIQRKMGFKGYELSFDTTREPDAVKAATSDDIRIKNGSLLINESREKNGLDPLPQPECNIPLIITPQGPVPLEGAVERTDILTQAKAKQGQTKPGDDDGNNPEPSGNKAKKKLRKSTTASIVIDSGKLTAKNAELTLKLERIIDRFFVRARRNIAQAIRAEYKGNKPLKADVSDQNQPDPKKPELLFGGAEATDLQRHTAQALILLANSWLPWAVLADDVEPFLNDAGIDGVGIGEDQLLDIGATGDSSTIVENASEAATRYARMRSAQMVGKKRLADGTLVDNPDAVWAISETTREDLRATIEQAIEEGWTPSQLAAVIEVSTTFSSARAKLIADTEMRNAQSRGTYLLWALSGVKVMVRWQTTEDERVCPICDDFEDQGVVPLGHQFAPGIEHPTAHPLCRCLLKVVDDAQPS